jgi:hypothetical protein
LDEVVLLDTDADVWHRTRTAGEWEKRVVMSIGGTEILELKYGLPEPGEEWDSLSLEMGNLGISGQGGFAMSLRSIPYSVRLLKIQILKGEY